MEIMEFEKLQQIIAEVLNIDPEEITMNTTFVDDLGADSLCIPIIMVSRKSSTLRSRLRKLRRSQVSAMLLRQSKTH